MPPLPLCSYITHLSMVHDNHRKACEDMTQRGFPCVLSNDIDNPEDRYLNLSELSNRFLLFFTEPKNNNIAIWELGIALAINIEHVCIIGDKAHLSHLFIPPDRLQFFDNYQDFTYRHFFS